MHVYFLKKLVGERPVTKKKNYEFVVFYLVILQILVFIIVFYDLSLFISVNAFLPSLRVLKTSQDREKLIRMVSVIREI